MGKSDAEVQQAPLFNRFQRDAQEGLSNFITPQIGQAADVFGGQRVAGASDLQQGSFDLLGGLTPGVGSAIGGSFSGVGDSLQGFLGDFDPAQSQQAFQQGVADPALRNFQQNIIPGITERFSNVAGSSGVLSGALAKAGGDLQSDLSSQGALFNQRASETFDRNKLNATGQLAGQGALGLNFVDTLSRLGGQQRDISQQGLGADFSRFQEGQAVNNPILGLLPTLLGGRSSENIVTPADTSGADALTAAATAVASYYFSDRRLKKNVIQVGESNGINFYMWDWNDIARDQLGLEGSSIGVIAQEVIDLIPDAVEDDKESGYFMVDYNLVKERVS